MITILTEPSIKRTHRLYKAAKRLLKKYILKRNTPIYSGHFGVARSLIEGLEKIGAPYNYNPTRVKQMAEHVHVLGDIDTLQLAIKLKRQGRIKRLTAGPNVVVSSADHNGLVAAKEIDFYVVNSEWTKALYLRDNPQLTNRLGFFPSGVDAGFWETPKMQSTTLRLLFYKKNTDPVFYEECKKTAYRYGARVSEIVYGAYDLEELKKALTNTDWVVYFSASESQGIALAEIWATDTPTLVWNPGIWSYKGKQYECSSAPYLTPETGAFFRTGDDFDRLFAEGQLVGQKRGPRNWVLSNMTDEICARRFLKTVNGHEHN